MNAIQRVMPTILGLFIAVSFSPASHVAYVRHHSKKIVKHAFQLITVLAWFLFGCDASGQQEPVDASKSYRRLQLEAESVWLREPAKACDLFEQAIKIADKGPEFGEWEMANLRSSMASVLRYRGQLTQARSTLLINLAMSRKHGFDGRWPLLSDVAGLLDVYTLEGDYKSVQRLSDEFVPLIDASISKNPKDFLNWIPLTKA